MVCSQTVVSDQTQSHNYGASFLVGFSMPGGPSGSSQGNPGGFSAAWYNPPAETVLCALCETAAVVGERAVHHADLHAGRSSRPLTGCSRSPPRPSTPTCTRSPMGRSFASASSAAAATRAQPTGASRDPRLTSALASATAGGRRWSPRCP